MRRASLLLVTLVASAAATAPAYAAAPSNDDRGNARPLDHFPTTVNGTTVEATAETNEPASGCANAPNSVWYRLVAPSSGAVALTLTAQGDLDAVVDVYKATRSRLANLACDITDEQGQATADFDVKAGDVILVRVAPLFSSVAGTFRLQLVLAQPPARAPGPALGSTGKTDSVDRVLNPSDAWHTTLRAGRTYRVNFPTSGNRCPSLVLYPPGTRSFNDAPDPVLTSSCGGYRLYTPRRTGRYVFRIAAGRGTGAQRYHLQVAPAQRDDTSPGLYIANYRRVHGALQRSHVDAVDLYRFDIRTRSDLKLVLAGRSGDLDIQLLNDRGRRIRCGCGDDSDEEIETAISPGRYFVAVRANSGDSRYTLTRITRTITHTRTTVNGAGSATIGPGASAVFRAAVSPLVSGPVNLVIERFDPLDGWQFYRQVRTSANAGVSFHPPSVGRWRAQATFLGTRTASSSRGGFATLVVQGPLGP